MPQGTSIFPTFFLSGFECSTFDWMGKGRRDLAEETQHYGHADEDYRMLAEIGIAVAREGIPWPLIDRGNGDYDFSCIDPFLDAQRRHKVLPIWTLCHYGYPDGLDPLSDKFVERFTAFARAAARYVGERAHHGPLFITPINEPTYFGYMGGQYGWVAPFQKKAEYRRRLTAALGRADITAAKAIREDFPDARMVHIDPLIWVVPPRNRPDLADEARRESCDDAYLAWDIIAGFKHPEYGGSLEILDIIGFNNYSFGQMELRGDGPHDSLEPGDDRIRPVCDLIEEAWAKYKRPCIVAETSGLGAGRPYWLNDLLQECMAAVNRDVDVHGICLFPAVEMPAWHSGDWLHNGIADVERLPNGVLTRKPYQPLIDCLHDWQRRLKRVTELDEDPYDKAVDLQDIVRAAKQLEPAADVDWH